MFPTTMAVHAADAQAFSFAGLPLSDFEFTVLTKESSVAATYQCAEQCRPCGIEGNSSDNSRVTAVC